MQPSMCEVCGSQGDGIVVTQVRTTNGSLFWCSQCRDDINRKNPRVVAHAGDISHERQRIRDILWKTPIPGDWSEQAQRYVTYMVAEFDKLICGLDEPERDTK